MKEEMLAKHHIFLDTLWSTGFSLSHQIMKHHQLLTGSLSYYGARTSPLPPTPSHRSGNRSWRERGNRRERVRVGYYSNYSSYSIPPLTPSLLFPLHFPLFYLFSLFHFAPSVPSPIPSLRLPLTRISQHPDPLL